jgi:four helix bundle protein
MGSSNILKTKSYVFALEIVKHSKTIKETYKEYDLARQLLRSGTAIGALIREAEFGQSRADLINKLSIALKEANETDYWLSLLKDSDLLTEDIFNQLSNQCEELIKMLVASIKTAKKKLMENKNL